MGDYIGFIPNYTGPWISNGNFQESVEFGDRKPKDQLDALSRLHDSAYAKWDDKLHRTVADSIYNEEASRLVGTFPELARGLVLYGNHVTRSWDTLSKRVGQLGPLGILVGGFENAYNLNDYVMNSDDVRKEVLAYYDTDPFVHFQIGRSKTMGNTDSFYQKEAKDAEARYKQPDKEYNPRENTDEAAYAQVRTKVRLPGRRMIPIGVNPTNSYDSYNENVSNRVYTGDYKNKSMLGFTNGGDSRPVYYYPHQNRFKNLKRTRRGTKIYIA